MIYTNLFPIGYRPSNVYKEMNRDKQIVMNPMLYTGIIQQTILMTKVPDRTEIINRYAANNPNKKSGL